MRIPSTSENHIDLRKRYTGGFDDETGYLAKVFGIESQVFMEILDEDSLT